MGSHINVVTTSVYERWSRGYGDAIMLRPAIIAKMKLRPTDRHILHICAGHEMMFEDIDNLEIVPISGATNESRLGFSQSLMYRYGSHEYYQLSEPCLIYENKYMPNVDKSRQEIFCEVMGIPLSLDYNVKFSTAEKVFANYWLQGIGKAIGVHMYSYDNWRDYKYMSSLIEYIAKRYDGYVVTFDTEWRYRGKLSNVRSLVNDNIREVWAVMSKMKVGIGIDSFGVHAFGSTGVPTYGIFGPTDPSKRLLYSTVAWSPMFKICKCQYCWYNVCGKRMVGGAIKSRGIPCINSRSPKFYWNDIKRKMGVYL